MADFFLTATRKLVVYNSDVHGSFCFFDKPVNYPNRDDLVIILGWGCHEDGEQVLFIDTKTGMFYPAEVHVDPRDPEGDYAEHWRREMYPGGDGWDDVCYMFHHVFNAAGECRPLSTKQWDRAIQIMAATKRK